MERHTTEEYLNEHLYLVSTFVENKWRISLSVIEKEIMHQLPSTIKIPLRIMKYLSCMFVIENNSYAEDASPNTKQQILMKFGYKSLIPSYMIKLFFLRSIIETVIHQGDTTVNFTESILLNSHSIVKNTFISLLQNLKQLGSDDKEIDFRSFLFGKEHFHKLNQIERDQKSWYRLMFEHIEEIVWMSQDQQDELVTRKINFPAMPYVIPWDNDTQEILLKNSL